jgi:hypothetical protein
MKNGNRNLRNGNGNGNFLAEVEMEMERRFPAEQIWLIWIFRFMVVLHGQSKRPNM